MRNGIEMLKSCSINAELSPPVPGCGCEEAQHQPSFVVPWRCGSSVGSPTRTGSHQQAECETGFIPLLLFMEGYWLLIALPHRRRRMVSSCLCPLTGWASLSPAQLRRSSGPWTSGSSTDTWDTWESPKSPQRFVFRAQLHVRKQTV